MSDFGDHLATAVAAVNAADPSRTIAASVASGDLLIDVVDQRFGDDEQPQFLAVVEGAKAAIRQYFEDNGWDGSAL
jgi:hypothetical protein